MLLIQMSAILNFTLADCFNCDPYWTCSLALLAGCIAGCVVTYSRNCSAPLVVVLRRKQNYALRRGGGVRTLNFFVLYSSPHACKCKSIYNDVIMCSNEKSWPRKKTGQAIVARLLHVDMYDEAGSMWFSVNFFWFTDTVFGNWTVDPTLNETCHSQKSHCLCELRPTHRQADL